MTIIEDIEYIKSQKFENASLANLIEYMKINRRGLDIHMATQEALLNAMDKLIKESQEDKTDE